LDVLVLDDHEPTRELMEFAIGRMGHRVLCSSSVQEAINLLHTFVFDVMICDLSLPDGCGLDVIRHVPAGQEVCKIVLSGHGEMTDVARSLAAGFDVHLVKPVDLQLLQRAVLKVTGRPL
jgi:CheY-like chemotaxis protein